MKTKPQFATDFYKTGHIFQYPEGTELVYSNFTARSDRLAEMSSLFDGKTVFFSLQGYIKEFLIEAWNESFFNRPKDEVVSEYKRRMDTALGPNSVDVAHIAELHDLGYLPIVIKALPEGARVNIKVPMLTMYNTLPKFYWLVNYLETSLSFSLWKGITSATTSYEYRRVIDKYVELTGSNKDFAWWQAHDFSMRGMSGLHDASVSGAAVLLSTYGTDTIHAIPYLEEYYNADADKELIGGSVPATEHSVMCMGGNEEEIETFRRLIEDAYPSGVVSIVSDTWDFWKVITEYSVQLKDKILARQPNALGLAKVVFRPDSGDPVKIITGLKSINCDDVTADDLEYYDVIELDGKYFTFKTLYEYYDDFPCGFTLEDEVPQHVVKGAVECLWDIFGGDITEKGYKTLNQRVGLIYGDSITLERAEQIFERLMAKGFSAGNIVFGVGSFTYQYATRDTFGMAVKATYGIVNGEGRELFKDPKTDNGTKKSAKGLLRVEKEGDDYVLYDQQTWEQEGQGELRKVFVNGHLFVDTSLAQIRERLHG